MLRRGNSRWVVAALAAAVAIGLGALTWSSSTVEAAPRDITGGHLDWGVKASFRTYITGQIANGSITLSEGATQNGDGTFRFPAVATGTYNEETGALTSTYAGKVFFTGHGGLLEMEITDIRVQWSNNSGLLIADVVSKSLDSGTPVAYPDVEFAELDLTGVSPTQAGSQFSWVGVPATLTEDGEPAFANFYDPGTPLDPVSPTLNLDSIGSLAWRISNHAFTSSSLAPSHATGSPATKVADPGGYFLWQSYQVNSYDGITGATDISFDGSVTLGNVSQGGYRIMFDNPRIVIDGNNNGEIRADVSYCVSTAACANPWVGPILDVTLTTFITNPGAITDTGTHVSWTFTPEYASVGDSFYSELINALDVSLRGHFRLTGGASDPNKPPAPITVEFDCTGVNSDRNFINNAPFVVNDVTRANSDATGNVCDNDDDNDGLGDAAEASGSACGGTVTNATLHDTDADRYLDGAECALGTNPTSAASKPTAAACAAEVGVALTVDTDADRLKDFIEYCYYNTSPTDTDTDDDQATTGGSDGCEAASVNPDRIVNVADRGLVSLAIASPTMRNVNVDVNKDGAWNVGDIGFVALSFGQCP